MCWARTAPVKIQNHLLEGPSSLQGKIFLTFDVQTGILGKRSLLQKVVETLKVPKNSLILPMLSFVWPTYKIWSVWISTKYYRYLIKYSLILLFMYISYGRLLGTSAKHASICLTVRGNTSHINQISLSFC